MQDILLMTDGVYRIKLGTSLIPINSKTRGTAHVDNIGKIPSLILQAHYTMKDLNFELIPYALPNWADNIETIISKYYHENQTINQVSWEPTTTSWDVLQVSYP